MTFTYTTGFSVDPAASQRSRLSSALRSDLDRLASESVTGRAADQPAALNGRTAEALRLGTRIDALDGFADAAEVGAERLGAKQTVLTAVRDNVETLFKDLQSILSANAPAAPELAAEVATQALQSVVSALNTSYAGASLFTGDRPDVGALADADTILADSIATAAGAGGGAAGAAALRAAFDTPGGAFDTLYYTGGTGEAAGIGVDTDLVIANPLRADDPAIRDALREITAVAALASPGVTADRDALIATLEEARDGLIQTIEPLATAAGRLGQSEQALQEAEIQSRAEETALTLARESLIERDQFSAASELNVVETALETLFAATGRLSQLTLSSYIR